MLRTKYQKSPAPTVGFTNEPIYTSQLSSCALCKKPIDHYHWDEDQASVIMICCGHFLCTSCDGPVQERKRSQAINKELVQMIKDKDVAVNHETINTTALAKTLYDICDRVAPMCPVCNAPFPDSAVDCIERINRLEDMGHPAASHNLGRVYTLGSPDMKVKPNSRLACTYFLKGAKQGNAHSQAYVGDRYLHGNGIKCCYKQAKEWYEKAADQGQARGLHGLGCLYRDGKGVAIQLEKAMEYFKLSAEQDYPPAVRDYAICLQNCSKSNVTGKSSNAGTKKRRNKSIGQACISQEQETDAEERKAQEWFLRGARNELLVSTEAADSGFREDIAFCQYQSAKLLLSCGLRHSLPYALFWANRAMKNGNSAAKEVIKQCRNEVWKKCAHCGKPNPKSACRGCNGAAYCNSKCQKLHWKQNENGHKDVCQAVSKGLLIENKDINIPHSKTECAYCGTEEASAGTKLRSCSRCGEAWYCGGQCQRMHWKGIGDGRMCAHKCECKKKGV